MNRATWHVNTRIPDERSDITGHGRHNRLLVFRGIGDEANVIGRVYPWDLDVPDWVEVERGNQVREFGVSINPQDRKV